MINTKERREMESKRFKIDTTVNITHILTTIGLVIALFSWGADIKTMVARHEDRLNYADTRSDRNDLRNQAQFNELKNDIKELRLDIKKYALEPGPLPNYKGRNQ